MLAVPGYVEAFLPRRFSAAIALLDRAIAAGPSSATAWSMSSVTGGYVGDGLTAVRDAEQGVRLSPLRARLYWYERLLAPAHYVDSDYEQTLGWDGIAVERSESIRFNIPRLIAALAALGRTDEALEAAQHLLRIQPDFRLGSFAKRCPIVRPSLDTWLARLRSAGLPA